MDVQIKRSKINLPSRKKYGIGTRRTSKLVPRIGMEVLKKYQRIDLSTLRSHPTNIYLFKVNDRNTKKRCEI